MIPKTPDYSFKNEVPLSNVMDMIANKRLKEAQLDKMTFDRSQENINNVLQTTQMASQGVQNMVKMARDNQMFAAKNELATLLSTGNKQVPAPGTIPGSPMPGSSGPFPSVQGPNPQPIPFSQTPEYNNQVDSLLMKAAPDTTLKEMAQQRYSEKLLAGQNTGNITKQNYLVDGVPRATFTNRNGDIFDASNHEILNGRDIKPYTPPSPYADARLDISAQQTLSSMEKEFRASITNNPSAKVVVAADNFSNQIDRVLKGEVVPDKTTMTALMSEAERALASGGVSSEKRMESLLPNTFKGKVADMISYATNNPTSRDSQEFLKNLRVEVKASGDQRRANVEQGVRGILTSARLAQKRDPAGYDAVVRGWGIDPNAARAGKIRFLPGSGSLLYGDGYGQSGSANGSQSGINIDEDALNAEIARRKL